MLNVLVVDDSAVARAMILKTLKAAGLEMGQTHQASNGQEGLDVLEANWVDLAFVDVNMPVMNGEEMIAAMRANAAWADLPVIVVSTEGSETRIGRLENMGAKFIHKPFSPETVRDLVGQVTGACQ